MEIVRSTVFAQFPELCFGMSTNYPLSNRPFGFNMSYHVGDVPEQVAENRQHFFSFLGISKEQIAFPKQEHTNVVKIISAVENPVATDGLITSTVGLFLGISIADCTPLMFYDSEKKVIAAVHAGWRGTSKRIAEQTVQMLRKTFHSSPKNIYVFIGPSAGVCCYEVGEEVTAQFPKTCFLANGNGKYFLDVKKANFEQLLENEIPKEHIEIHSDCTISNSRYHSYRRDGKHSGRMLAVIGLTR
ncbi:MAG: peptidoglycan editing factor PgeF [Bacteroidetes bacterium]|nr:peptidoglycan editing factor PgeF [Bacteroidota bacterium]